MTKQHPVILRLGERSVERILETSTAEPWTLTLLSESGDQSEFSHTAGDLFECLAELRHAYLEPRGIVILVQGARREVYPSRMARQMSGGQKVYVSRMKQPALNTDMVDTFAAAPADAAFASVAEQRDYHARWIASLG